MIKCFELGHTSEGPNIIWANGNEDICNIPHRPEIFKQSNLTSWDITLYSSNTSIDMPRKTSFSYPLGGVSEDVVVQPRKNKRGVRSTEVAIPLHSSKEKASMGNNSGKSSVSKVQASRYTEGASTQTSKHPTHDTEESYTLRFTEGHDLEPHDDHTDDMPSQSNVCIIMHICSSHLHTLYSADTHGPVAEIPEQISPPFIGDGRTD